VAAQKPESASLCHTAGVKRRAWLWIAACAILVACAAGIAVVLRERALALKPTSLVRRLPVRDAVVVSIDFAALRSAGLMQLIEGSKVARDPEYQAFVKASHFDYARDLDTAVVAFAPNGRFLALAGRFDWKSLAAYVRGQGGACADDFCRMTGSAPERRISFFPVRSGLMALAVSQDDSAAVRLEAESGPPIDVPAAPVWLMAPGSLLSSGEALPADAREFARALGGAELLTLAIAPNGARLAATLEIRCRAAADASNIAGQLARTTTTLRDSIARSGHAPNPAELGGVLAAGEFRVEGVRAIGRWPIERVFLESVLGAP
jgi:hypothetical protein